MKAIRVHELGGPDVLRYEEVSVPTLGPGEALVRVEAIGVNFVDVYHRSGLSHVHKTALPFTPGMEAAGTVVDTASGVTEVQVGDRIGYATHQQTYADFAVAPADKLVKLPQALEARSAAAVMLQGMTAHYLAFSTYPLKPGDTALVHAAAGGVGLLLTQIAKMRGARVFGTVSTREKAALAREAGADEVILYTEQDFEAEVMRLTKGQGVNVVYDSVGKMTFDKSLNCLALRGTLALFGQSSGPAHPVDLWTRLWPNGAFLTRPSLLHYTATRAELIQRAGNVFDWVKCGQLKVRIHQILPLKEAAEAHRLLESRKTIGKVLLIP